MDFVLSRLQAVLAGFSRAQSASSGEVEPSLPPAFPLSKIQVVMARRNGSMIPVHLMVDGISSEHLLFKTASRLRQGELLQLETLLTGVGSVSLHGKVEWLLNSRAGFSGQITLDLKPEEQEKINRFIALQRQGSRG